MKNLKIASLALLLGLVVIASCKTDPPPEPTAEEVQTALLAQIWKAGTATNDITYNGANEIGNWDGFTVTFNANGTYATTNTSEGREDVWPSTGSWEFKGKGTDVVDVNTIIRDAGSNNETSIAIVVAETTLRMTFNYTNPGGRLGGTEGPWVFNMVE
ncbi:MAG: hypothetical protein L3J06_01135 [Cyclobacteriaceae bacterium]|nr:hypothetical protein [Cyclobacteriaceae bacterium]